jgi:hypothetical protein
MVRMTYGKNKWGAPYVEGEISAAIPVNVGLGLSSIIGQSPIKVHGTFNTNTSEYTTSVEVPLSQPLPNQQPTTLTLKQDVQARTFSAIGKVTAPDGSYVNFKNDGTVEFLVKVSNGQIQFIAGQLTLSNGLLPLNPPAVNKFYDTSVPITIEVDVDPATSKPTFGYLVMDLPNNLGSIQLAVKQNDPKPQIVRYKDNLPSGWIISASFSPTTGPQFVIEHPQLGTLGVEQRGGQISYSFPGTNKGFRYKRGEFQAVLPFTDADKSALTVVGNHLNANIDTKFGSLVLSSEGRVGVQHRVDSHGSTVTLSIDGTSYKVIVDYPDVYGVLGGNLTASAEYKQGKLEIQGAYQFMNFGLF